MTITNKTQLSTIQESVIENQQIKTLTRPMINKDASKIIVIKRGHRGEEFYNPEKMWKVCVWASGGDEHIAKSLLDATKIKLYNKIHITDVYDQLINTAVNKISEVNPVYELVAAKLELLKFYRRVANIKTNKEYPKMSEIIEKGIHHKIYEPKIFNDYTREELDKIDAAINPDLDYLFTYKSLMTFTSKYCLSYSKKKVLELIQHAYMRVAMSLFVNEKTDRVKFVIDFYKELANHSFTVATPIMLNSGTPNSQLSSCVLSKMGDSADSIMDSSKDVAIYSKFKGGNAVDISSVRSSGSYILGNSGISSGPVPFIKILESTIKAFNQGSSRPGACAIYFQWWHLNFEELVVLKSNSGTEENRARHLKYAVKINELLIKRMLANETVTLFNPHDVPGLKNKFGKEFEHAYEEYEKKAKIIKKTMNARELFAMIMKERVETGNVYLFHEENVNQVSMLNRYINSSNLCCEITLPSVESKIIAQEIIEDQETGEKTINKKYHAGEIALCNLASINLVTWAKRSKSKQQNLINLLVRAMDNSIDLANYPVPEGKITNLKYRYLGIGVLNFANLLAIEKIVIDTQEALEYVNKMYDDLSYQIILASHKLAEIKGPYEMFHESRWAKGDLPIFNANPQAKKLTKYQPDLEKWQLLANEIKRKGMRNAQVMAIAPTATSGKAINATESIEPIQNYHYKEDGKKNIVTLVPNIKNRKYYKLSFDCDQYKLLENAAIRQMYIDQAQSVNMYFRKVTSLTDFTMYHLYAFKLGIKTLYYCKTEKENSIVDCESCT